MPINITRHRATIHRGGRAIAFLLSTACLASQAHAQAVPNLVSACAGVSLPRSAVTGIITPVVNGIVAPTENTVNTTLGVLGNLPIIPVLDIDTTTLFANAAAGDPISLQVLNSMGQVVGPDDRCDLQADSFSLDQQGGIAVGGNRIAGLGTNGLDASAGEAGSIALGNSANTAATSINAMAIGTGASVAANAPGGTALGAGARVTAANSVALGADSTATRGALAGYAVVGLATPQTSTGEVSVGTAGAERQISNVAAGSALTDAANIAQLSGVADQVAALGSAAVLYDGTDKSVVTLAGTDGTRITNLQPGKLSATSTDAVNGAQLYATNANVANNTTAIANLTNSITNGAAGPVQYSGPGDLTLPNGGTRTNDLTLVGAAAGPVGLHNVGNGSILPGSTDAVNGGQIYGLALTAVNAVSYDTDANGVRTNTVTLAGGAAGPVTIANVADGTVAPGSTQAVNGGQLAATNQAVTTAQTTANTALTLGANSVQYDNASHTSVTLGTNTGDAARAPVTVHNVAPGTAPTDAVNVAQLNSGINSALTQANSFTDQRFATINYDLRKVRRDSNAGTAGALAAAALPQAYEAGKGMIAMAGGTYQGQTAFALGLSKALNDSHTVVRLNATYDTRGHAGGAAGVGYQF